MSIRTAKNPSKPRSLLTAAGFVVLVALGLSAAPFAAHADPIPSDLAYTRDGCERDTLGLLDWRDGAQEWVYVNNARDPVVMRGEVVDSKVTKEDLYATHETRGVWGTQDYYINHDLNVYVRPDSGYDDLLATGNYAPYVNDNGVDVSGTLEVEAQTGEWAFEDQYAEWRDFYPTFAWPAPNDRAEMIGPHVWDCGHWDNGERTEIHPPAWVHIDRTRDVGYEFTAGQPSIAKEHDLYANSNKQLAGIIAEWELTGQETRQNEEVINGRRTFFLEAPPKPTKGARLLYREERMRVRLLSNVAVTTVPLPYGLPFDVARRAGIRPHAPGIGVTVSVQGQSPLPDAPDLGYAAKWFVGWDQSTTGFKKVRTRFLKVRCNNDLDTFGDGEWHMYFRAQSSFAFNFDAGLNSCSDGGLFGDPDEVVLNPTPTFEQIVPDNRQLDLEVAGYDNDDPLPGQWAGTYRAQRPLQDSSGWVSAANFDALIETTVLETYPPALPS